MPSQSRAARESKRPSSKKKTPAAATSAARARGKSASKSKPPSKSLRLPLVSQPERGQVPCLTCGLCCTYVAVDIDEPTCMTDAAHILWYLYHDQISVYFDGEDSWTLQFDARCNHLQADNKCAIYDKRPQICRTYSEQTCEVNAEDEGITFTVADEFLAWLQQHQRATYRKLSQRYLPGAEHLVGKPQDPRRLPPFFPTFKKLRKKGLQIARD